MNLLTKVPIVPCPSPISYDSRLLLLGSCFTTHIGARLEYFKFPLRLNPFGIIYQPTSLQRLIHRVVREEYYSIDELFHFGETWHSFEVHSELNRPSPGELVELLNRQIQETLQGLQDSSHLLITLGSAWTYRYLKNDELVANCHKLPQREFRKELLSQGQVMDSLEKLTADVRSVNEGIHILFTISPVRHLKDGFSGNQRSKAHLISGLHSFLEAAGENSGFSYFPAYEIQLDELRDYRFYDPDLLHPNEMAIQYIWEKFKSGCIGPDAYPVMEEVSEIRKGLEHRPFNKESDTYRNFRKGLEEKISNLSSRYPHIGFKL